MPQETSYPRWFADILDHARKAKNLPMNKEIAEIFWSHIKRYSMNEEAVKRAFNQMIELGDYMEPANVIKHIPREYKDTMRDWPEFRDIETPTNIAKDCIFLINKKMAGKLTKKEYFEGMMVLHEKYPKAGFAHVAEQYARGITQEVMSQSDRGDR